MSPKQAGALIKLAYDLVAQRRLTVKQAGFYNALLFRDRAQGRDRCQVSYATMAGNLHMGRTAIADALAAFEACGLLLRRIHTRVRLAVGTWKGTNIYVFPQISTASPPGTTFRVVSKKEAQEQGISTGLPLSRPMGSELEAALAKLAQRMAGPNSSANRKPD